MPQKVYRIPGYSFMSTKHLDKLHPQYDFFLNPYDDLRFTSCPKCNAKTSHWKLPLVIWVEPHHPVSINYTCLYCQTCDLLIAHQNEIEDLLAKIFQPLAPEVIGNNYTIKSGKTNLPRILGVLALR